MTVAPALGVARDVPAMLRAARRRPVDAETAVAGGLLWREKVEGLWVYATSEDAMSSAEEFAFAATENTLDSWLLGPLHPLTGSVAKTVKSPSLSKDVVRQFVRRWLRENRLDALGMLTDEYEPYLVAFLPRDRDEVEHQVAFVAVQVGAQDSVSTSDLPEPLRARSLTAWRDSLLRHAEFLGLGHYEAGELLAWP